MAVLNDSDNYACFAIVMSALVEKHISRQQHRLMCIILYKGHSPTSENMRT
jgi:hypothetical protein